jgi:hypothetical protein
MKVSQSVVKWVYPPGPPIRGVTVQVPRIVVQKAAMGPASAQTRSKLLSERRQPIQHHHFFIVIPLGGAAAPPRHGSDC